MATQSLHGFWPKLRCVNPFGYASHLRPPFLQCYETSDSIFSAYLIENLDEAEIVYGGIIGALHAIDADQQADRHLTDSDFLSLTWLLRRQVEELAGVIRGC